ncbi:hypothetical protein [Streptomyces lavenduligriseus]|uniref:Uncharacterized protein n=1 Tax=Streptomyces lavenduligriseus TaxID=67315 RepID=A0ABT0P399_9ACTN|nr:hypothetical protein [Streptomyces lavenduligriseus]MCL3998209.1 hypothetical protein [Streptomyces lavenduligriseus]
MATDTDRSAASGGSARSGTSSPRSALRRHDPRETRETWFHLAGPDRQDPTPEGS